MHTILTAAPSCCFFSHERVGAGLTKPFYHEVSPPVLHAGGLISLPYGGHRRQL
jgi:hypothetical protein